MIIIFYGLKPTFVFCYLSPVLKDRAIQGRAIQGRDDHCRNAFRKGESSTLSNLIMENY
jgi:hypothetical protein